MGINIDIVFDYLGRLKLATVVVGSVDLILIWSSYYSASYYDARDQAFLSAVLICLIFSFLLVLGVVLEYVVVSDFYEMVFFSAASLLLLGTNTFFLISILKHSKKEHFVARIFAMLFGYINAAIYGYLPWTVLKSF